MWLSILKRGIVAKGNHKILVTYIIHSNSKNSNKTKLIKSMYRIYNESQGFNWLKSWIYYLDMLSIVGRNIGMLDKCVKKLVSYVTLELMIYYKGKGRIDS